MKHYILITLINHNQAVTGVDGSGKSTLVAQFLQNEYSGTPRKCYIIVAKNNKRESCYIWLMSVAFSSPQIQFVFQASRSRWPDY